MEATRKQISVTQIVIILLAVATASVHLYLALTTQGDPLTTIMFGLNFLGYITLAIVYNLPWGIFGRYHNLVRYAFMGFTLLTIILWAVMGMRIPLAYVDKTVEIILVILLFRDR